MKRTVARALCAVLVLILLVACADTKANEIVPTQTTKPNIDTLLPSATVRPFVRVVESWGAPATSELPASDTPILTASRTPTLTPAPSHTLRPQSPTLTPLPPGAVITPSDITFCGLGWTRLGMGMTARVASNNLIPNRIRSEPKIADNILTQLDPGQIMKVIDGPVCEGTYVFWLVQNANIPGGAGWTAEGDRYNYYLEPYPPDQPTPTRPAQTATVTPIALKIATPTNAAHQPATPEGTPGSKQWVKIDANSPSAERGMGWVYDSSRGVSVLFGGMAGSKTLAETWEFDGKTWKQVITGHSPSARLWHGMVYDPARKVVVLYGGQTGDGRDITYGDTWEYNGRDWKQISTVHSPGLRGYGPAMAYDTCRMVTILYGAPATMSTPLSTWEYDGKDWKEVATKDAPSRRGLSVIAFDSRRCKAVLFGGINSLTANDDTWTYEGTNWTRVITAHTPESRWAHAMTFDPRAGQVVMHGGYHPKQSGGYQLSGTWTFDGNDWTLYSSWSAPAWEQQGMVFDEKLDAILMYGYKQTWQWH